MKAKLLAMLALLAACGPGAVSGDDVAGPDAAPACTLAAPAVRIAEAILGGDDQTSITLVWEPVADAATYRIERSASASPDGPWATAGSTVAGVVTFTDPTLLTSDVAYRVVAVGDCEAASPAQPAFAVAKARYDLDDQEVAGVPFRPTLGGLVRFPRDLAGSHPLVLMLHGNHEICALTNFGDGCPSDFPDTGAVDNKCHDPSTATVPNADGYTYLLETLAAQGYIAVSVDANAFNCRDDYVPERAQLLLAHLQLWARLASPAGAAPFGTQFAGAVDLAHVGLMGHSRGGAAVSLVPSAIAEQPIAGVTVASVFAVAPTNHDTPFPAGVPYAVLVPTCDGDVWSLDGVAIYDRVRHAEPAVARSQLVLTGANHNGFNTVWQQDDNDAAESFGVPRACAESGMMGGDAVAARPAQEGMLELTLAAWFDATLRGAPLPAFFRGEAPPPPSMSAWAGQPIDLRASYRGPGATVIDDLRDPARNRRGEPNTYDGFGTSAPCSGAGCDQALAVCDQVSCNGDREASCSGDGCDMPYELWHYDGDVSAVALSWTGADGHARFPLGDLDASAAAGLSLRLAAADADLNPAGSDVDLSIRVDDTAGHGVVLAVSAVAPLPRLYLTRRPGEGGNVRPARELLQTIRLPLDRLRGLGELDVAHLAGIELITDRVATGAIIVTDVELSD